VILSQLPLSLVVYWLISSNLCVCISLGCTRKAGTAIAEIFCQEEEIFQEATKPNWPREAWILLARYFKSSAATPAPGYFTYSTTKYKFYLTKF
jgi:hypothetical protein